MNNFSVFKTLFDHMVSMIGREADQKAKLRQQVAIADHDRATGVMASLSRGSVLLRLEQVPEYDEERTPQGGRDVPIF